MRITLLQTAPEWGNPAQSREDARRMLMGTQKTDLVVLPEMFSTGFVTDPVGVAEEGEGDSLRWMQDYARNRGCAITGSVSTHVDGSYRNRLYFVFPDGHYQYYDKHHLFTYGGENNSYTPGQQHVIVNYMGFRLLLQTCYDLRFPCWSRYADNLKYDAIIYVANWPSSRQSAWQLLIRARAIENQCYTIGVNRVGDDQRCHYIGASAVIDVTGRTVAQCRRGVPQALMCEIQMEELQRRREKFRVLDDRD